MRGSWLQRSNKSKVLTSFKGSRASGHSLRGSWLQKCNMSKSSKVSKALGRQVSKVKGSRVNYEFMDIKIVGFRAVMRFQGLPVA